MEMKARRKRSPRFSDFTKPSRTAAGCFGVAKRALESNPADLVAANNCASLGLLLNGDSAARRLATKRHSENPDNVAFSSTYAFALFTEGKTSEALREMETLKETPAIRNEPKRWQEGDVLR